MNEKRSQSSLRKVTFTSATVFVALLIVGFGLFGLRNLLEPKTIEDVIANDESSDPVDDQWAWDGLENNPLSNGVNEQEQTGQAKINTIKTNAVLATTQVSQTSTEDTNSTANEDNETSGDEINIPSDEDDGDSDEDQILISYNLADFENGDINDWEGGISTKTPGFSSDFAGKLTSEAGESTAAKRIIEAPVLKKYSALEFEINVNGDLLLPGDASAVAFEQDGSWKWVSLFDYTQPESGSWQHIKIPLSDFTGLNINNSVANLTFRFWSFSQTEYLLDNIQLTGLSTEELPAPHSLTGEILSDKEIRLNWSGDAEKYFIYKDGNWIGETAETSYTVSGLDPDSEYHFFVTAIYDYEESAPSENITLLTPSMPISSLILADFEDGNVSDWGENGVLAEGLDSLYALRLINSGNSAVGIEKTFNDNIARSHGNIEFDININGSYFYGEDAQLSFDQAGWKSVSLPEYLENGKSGWQHIIIPLSDFAELDTEAGIAKIIFRFWSFDSSVIDIDNIALN